MASSNRLISQFKPDSYELALNLNKKTKVFKGVLAISGVRRSKPSYRVTFNQSGLKITSARLYQVEKGQKVELKISRIVHHNKLQEVRLHTEKQLLSGKYEVELEYTGEVSTKGTNGFYTSTWLDDSSEKQEILTTQFEPHYARQLMPCIDEPEAKATFDLTLNLSEAGNDTVLFNTEIESEGTDNAGRKIKFFKTPVMSTYLLALIMGDLKSKSREVGDTQINVYSVSNRVEATEFALDFASKGLELLEKKFKTPYPLKKLDLVAVPDFDSGGMENWGLATFREDLLLFDDSNSTLGDKQSIALVIAHELAHQWFGNLVTMKWWDELWLNEGFANFIECYLVDQIFPEWKMLEHYLISDKSDAIRLDSLPSSRPIVNKVKTPYHAVDSFDAIAYEKSGSIIRMIFSILGEESFMLGLKDYFAKFSYKTATSADLLACWQKYTDLKLSQFTKTWLYEPGLPKVEVSIGENSKQIRLEQSRFLSESKTKISLSKAQREALITKPNAQRKQREFYLNELTNRLSKSYDPIWQIPVSFVFDEQRKESGLKDFVMKKDSHTIQLPKEGQLPIKLNRNGEAFYVTSYPLELLAMLSKSLEEGRISEPDMLNVLSDTISLNRASQFKPGPGAILDLMLSAKGIAKDAQFWGLAGGFISYLHYHLKQTGKTRLLKGYTSDLVGKKLAQVGFNASVKDSSSDIATRFELLSLSALSQNTECRAKLESLFDKVSGKILDIESEKRLLVLYVIGKRGKKKDHATLLEAYKENVGDASLRDDMGYGLCMFEDESLIRRSLEVMQDPELVKEQDILSWLSQLISSGQKGTQIVLRWVLKDDGWAWLDANLSPFDISSAVKIITSSAFTTKDMNILKRFFEGLENAEIKAALKESLEIAKSRISWHKKELPAVVDYLSGYRGEDSMFT